MRSQPPSHTARLAAIVTLLALLGTACGAVVTASEQRRALETTAAEPIIVEPVPLEPLGAPNAPSAAPESAAGGHQYGSTLDEWNQVEEDQRGQSSGLGEASPGYSDIEWADLIPAGSSGEELMARFEERLDAVEPGTDEASALYSEIQAEFNPEAVNTELEGEQIRLAGFVAPLTYDDDIITEFLLVPTFGACVHVPPPPPNQTIMVSVDREDGLTFDESWGAVWVEGTLVIESADSDLGATSYRITDATSGAYTNF